MEDQTERPKTDETLLVPDADITPVVEAESAVELPTPLEAEPGIEAEAVQPETFIEKLDALNAVLDSANVTEDESAAIPLAPEPILPEPAIEPDTLSPEPVERDVPSAGLPGVYARPDGANVTLIRCTVQGGTWEATRLSLAESPGKPSCEIVAPYSENGTPGTWVRR